MRILILIDGKAVAEGELEDGANLLVELPSSSSPFGRSLLLEKGRGATEVSGNGKKD